MICIMTVSFCGCSNKGQKDPEPTAAPTQAAEPTKEPTKAPTAAPTAVPTAEPTPEPTAEPEPTAVPAAETPVNIEVCIGTETEYIWDDTDEIYCGSYRYQYPYLSEEDRARYPGLDSAFKDIADARAAETQNYVDMLRNSKEDREDYGGYTIRLDMTVVRADSSIVCLRDRYEYYVDEWTGGSYGICFDPSTGERVWLSQIIKDKTAFVDLIYNEALQKAYSLNDPDNLKAAIQDCFDTDTLHFEIGYDYLGVIFNAYEIDASPVGLKVTIPFKGNESMINDRYLAAAENYMIDLGYDMIFFDDLGNDGLVDEFQIWCNLDETEEEQGYGDFDSIAVYINGYSEIVLFPGYSCYGADAKFIHADGKNYLYVRYTFDSEDTITKVYRIYTTAEGFRPETWENPFADVTEIGVEWDIYGNCSYDPKNIELETRVDIVGTSFVKNRFSIGEDGMMTVKDDVYDFIYSWFEMTAKQDIAMRRIDKATGAELGDYTAKAGEQFTLLDTDRESFIDLVKTGDDAALYRMAIEYVLHEYEDWSYKTYKPAGAESFDDLFEGIAYYD